MTPFAFEILTPARRVFEGAVEMLVAPADDGLIGVLAHHEPMLVRLKAGPLRVAQGGKTVEFRAGPGLLDITEKGACALVESAEAIQSDGG
ncbi:MAG: hypothetical protein GX608_01285 [Lentisphaerae bacterium]|nr:hypothetical protein [Lentisphaerota bacterium]